MGALVNDTTKAQLTAAREELGALELEGVVAILSARRCIARGGVVGAVEVAALRALIAAARAGLKELDRGWSERAAGGRVAEVECFACAKAARAGRASGCSVHVAEGVL